MTRHEQRRLDDIRAAIEAIRSHLTRGELSDGLIFDAVRVRLIEIGEAVKGLSAHSSPTRTRFHGIRSPPCEIDSRIATSTRRMPSSKRPSNMTSRNWSRRSTASERAANDEELAP